ncbi:MAG: alpha-glucan family phosphorylase [Bacteroidota bacterium]
MVGSLTQKSAQLKRIFIEPKLPESLAPLGELAQNLWWSWDHEASEMFRNIDPAEFERHQYNPVALLDGLSMEQVQTLVSDKAFVKRMNSVYNRFKAYMSVPKSENQPKIGYFCMEYGLHQSVRLYSGGLGVLAGDYLKEISDRNADFVAVGLLYRYGYFQQGISISGEQIHNYDAAKFTQLPLHPVRDSRNEWLKINISLAGRTVWAKVWELPVGRMSLYLLDTDIDDNAWEDRVITHQLYGGNNENRLRQELLLGIGGLRALNAMGVEPDLFHLNEGHAAFIGLERLRNFIRDKGLSYQAALEVVRTSQLFTTHTPVPAGHDTFSEDLLKNYIDEYTHALDLPWDELMALGRSHADNKEELFNVSHLAIRTSQEVNGVSRLHGDVSRKMFCELTPDYHHTENHIGYVTNSVHFPTWVASEWLDYYNQKLGKDFSDKQSDRKVWKKIQQAPASELMAIRKLLKKRLLDWARHSLTNDLMRRGENPRVTFEVVNAIKDDALVFGFARRFATYKRATLLFSNEQRLSEIVNNPDRPVIFLFAGKAHPADKGGQEYIRLIYNVTKNPAFRGKVIFLENYSMEMAKLLTAGVDVWLNNPTRPKEASGTSGMKAVMNGVMNFSVLDGWWCEGYKPGAGWALSEHDTYADPNLQNELDAETIYNILENDIIPTYYDTNTEGVSERWVQHIKNTISEIAPEFVMGRMLDDYYERFYNKLWTRSKQLCQHHYQHTHELTAWKKRVENTWKAIELIDLQAPDTFNRSLPLGEAFEASVTLRLQDLSPEDIGIEVVFYKRKSEEELELTGKHEMQFTRTNGTDSTYSCSFLPDGAGVFEYGFRMFPKHPMLPHRQDFALVRWL